VARRTLRIEVNKKGADAVRRVGWVAWMAGMEFPWSGGPELAKLPV
jgi:hypothetical protein